jgi:hypothetical protein
VLLTIELTLTDKMTSKLTQNKTPHPWSDQLQTLLRQARHLANLQIQQACQSQQLWLDPELVQY